MVCARWPRWGAWALGGGVRQRFRFPEDAPSRLGREARQVTVEFGGDLDAIGHGVLTNGSGRVWRARWLARAARIRARNRLSVDRR